MPRSGGVYTLPAGNPVVTLTVISSAWANTTMSDIATALTGSMPTDGTAAMTGVLRLVDGAVNAPGLTFATETTSGLYRIGAGDFGFSISGTKILELKSAVTTLTVFGVAGGNVAILGGVTITTAGNVTVAAPNSGVGLFVSGASTGIAFRALSSGATGVPIIADTNLATNSQNIQIAASGATGGTYGIGLDGSVSLIIGRTDVAHTALTISLAGNITVSAPTSGTALAISGLANTNAVTLTSPNTAGQSFGLSVTAGTNTTDYAALFASAAGAQLLKLFGTGGVLLAAATGGDQGLGTINATGLFINGGQLFFGAPTSLNTTATITDVGKVILMASNIAINNAVFSQGNIISIYNDTGTSFVINGSITTMRLAGTTTTGNRTLAPRGFATIWFRSSTECTVTGAGVS